MRTDRRTDMTKPIVTFRSYANTPKMFLIHAEMYISALFLLQNNAVGIATRYGMDGPGIESRWGQIFCTRTEQPWGPPSPLYSAYWGIPGGKAAGAWRLPPTPSSAEVKDRVQL
jgi:hypothetical protein